MVSIFVVVSIRKKNNTNGWHRLSSMKQYWAWDVLLWTLKIDRFMPFSTVTVNSIYFFTVSSVKHHAVYEKWRKK